MSSEAVTSDIQRWTVQGETNIKGPTHRKHNGLELFSIGTKPCITKHHYPKEQQRDTDLQDMVTMTTQNHQTGLNDELLDCFTEGSGKMRSHV